MGVVDWSFYSTVYGGTDATQQTFPALCARACDVIGALTHWLDDSAILKLPGLILNLYKKAVCAQIDFLSINGMDSLNETTTGGFTVGKVTVQGKGNTTGGALSESVSPLAIAYLEQTGLMNPAVPCIEGWW